MEQRNHELNSTWEEKILCLQVFLNLLENPPSLELLNNLTSQNLWQEWLYPTATPKLAQALELLGAVEASQESANAIGVDYTCLFISDIDFAKAPPYASFYLDKDGEIYSPHSDEVAAIYAKSGFVHARNTPPDSLFNEMGFLIFLLAREQNDTGAREFFKDEVALWLYQWSAKLIEHSKSDFYKGLGLLIEDFFEHL